MIKVQIQRGYGVFPHVFDLLQVGKHVFILWQTELLQKRGKGGPDLVWNSP